MYKKCYEWMPCLLCLRPFMNQCIILCSVAIDVLHSLMCLHWLYLHVIRHRRWMCCRAYCSSYCCHPHQCDHCWIIMIRNIAQVIVCWNVVRSCVHLLYCRNLTAYTVKVDTNTCSFSTHACIPWPCTRVTLLCIITYIYDCVYNIYILLLLPNNINYNTIATFK